MPFSGDHRMESDAFPLELKWRETRNISKQVNLICIEVAPTPHTNTNIRQASFDVIVAAKLEMID